MVFFLKRCMITANVRTFVIQWIARKQMSKLFKEAFVELSNLKKIRSRKFAISMNFGLLTVYLVNKIQFRLKLYFQLFDLENMYEFDDVI